MRRRAIAFLICALASLAFASGAEAAVSLEFSEAKREETTVNRGDELASYALKVKNTGSEATAGTTTVTFGLPAGAKLATASGAGWSCQLAANTCTSTSAIGAGAEFPQLKAQVWIYDEAAPDPFLVTFTASGGGAGAPAMASDSLSFGPRVPFEIAGFSAGAEDELGADYTLAGGHPFTATSSLEVSTHKTAQKGPLELAPVESLRDLYFELPAGFVGNPEAAPGICTVAQVKGNVCPEAAVVGGVSIDVGEFKNEKRAIFRVFPEKGYPAAFAFRPVSLSPITYVLRAKLRSNGDYGVTAVSPLAPQNPEFLRLNFARLCGYGAKIVDEGQNGIGFVGCKKPSEPGANPVPFLSNPTKCAGAPPVTRAEIDSYQSPGAQNPEGFPDLSDPNWKSAEEASPQNTGCEALSEAWASGGPASPSFTFRPDNTRAATPASYTAHLHIPQQGLLEESGRASAQLKDTTVLLPEGVALNPSAADGLAACSEAQAGYLGDNFGPPNPIHFSTVSEGCPGASKIGTVEVSTPILADPLQGAIYLAAQGANPFGSDFATYLVIDDEKTGIKATLAGEVNPNPATGQITATFLDNPQVPVEDLEVSFFGGSRSSLANPDVCATYTTQTALSPWSAKDPDNPAASEIATTADPVAIDQPAPGRAACPASKAGRPFEPGFSAKSTNPIAGAHTPFTLRITRPDGDQELSAITVTTPPGFAATLKGVATCSDAALAQALGRTASGDGAKELASPSCPASSQVGTTTIGAGVGSTPFYLKTGRIYLSGPYKSAPLSLSFIVPAVAGPFDLGVQVVRTALNVNPKTAQITAVSDPIPQILRGVPLQIRDVRVDLDRPGFSFNPTNCEAMAISAQISGGSGALANPSNRFQVGGCENLKFKPGLKLQLHGGTRRAAYQSLEATVTYPEGPGYANIARAAVTLPHSAFLATEHIRTVCTRVQFAAHACPKASVYGYAKAITPILDQPLSGPVYLRSSSNPLPDLVAALRGPDSMPIEVELAGRTDSVKGSNRNTFDLVPDAPVSKFTLNLFGGKRSLIVNSRNLCKGPKQRATARFTAQNGLQRNFRPVVGNDCGKKKAKRGR